MARARSLVPGRKAVLITVSLVGAVIVLAIVLLTVVFPPGIAISPTDGAVEVIPDASYLEISTSAWGASVHNVVVKEVKVAPDGSRGREKILDGQLADDKYVLKDSSNPLKSDAEYSVTVSGTVKELSLTGIYNQQVSQTHTFRTVVTPMPIIHDEGVYVRYGEDAVLEWNIPVSSFEYELDGIGSTVSIDSANPNLHLISLESFEQGREYGFTITAATSEKGMQLEEPIVTKLVTAPALTVQLEPADGFDNASTQERPAIIFSEPVSNPELVMSVVTVEPMIDGEFRWTAPDRLEFVPTASWEHMQDVTISLTGGVSQLRGTGGGYVEDDVASTFSTAPFKTIDVDISEQVLTLYENGVAVQSHYVSTGLSSTSTPMGDYTIYAKVNKTDMRGADYFAPDVPWVMVFMGDYTIHGNYWATSFGQRSSHGCVGMPVSVAKQVYDWTPIGTPLHIHE